MLTNHLTVNSRLLVQRQEKHGLRLNTWSRQLTTP